MKFTGPDVDLLLANRAELLLALEHVTMEMLRMPSEDHSRISFDANDYRLLRIEELRLSAVTAAEKVKRTGVPFRFNPMNSRERRVIHLALRNETAVRSESAGSRSGAARGGISGRHGQPARTSAQRRTSAPRRPWPRRCRRPRRRPRRSAVRGREGADRQALTVIGNLPFRRTIVSPRHHRRHLHPARTRRLGVVRLSGARPRIISAPILRHTAAWSPWRAELAELLDRDGHTVDQVVVTFFAGPRSYTAEDLVEISCHGSPVVLRHAVERALDAGARLAEPGEFTLRAFLNGRIDLPQAEAVRDLIDATTLYQARIAAQQVDGSVSRRIAPLKEQLLELIALLEAGIDFAEDDVSVAPAAEILRRLAPILDGVRRLADSFQYGGLVRRA